MAQRAERLKHLIGKARKIADGSQSAYMRAEDTLNALRERERQRAERTAEQVNRGRS